MKLATILVPIDFSPYSFDAARFAVELAEKIGAEITLFHAITAPPLYAFPDGTTLVPTAADIAKLMAEADLDLEAAKTALASVSSVKIQTRSTEGQCAEAILREAKRHDLVVMATHGRTGLKHVVLGSVAERIVRTCDRPVLTVRAGVTAIDARAHAPAH